MFWPPVLKDFEIVVVVYLKFHDITTHNNIPQSFLCSVFTFGKGPVNKVTQRCIQTAAARPPRTESDDSCGGGLGTRLKCSHSPALGRKTILN